MYKTKIVIKFIGEFGFDSGEGPVTLLPRLRKAAGAKLAALFWIEVVTNCD